MSFIAVGVGMGIGAASGGIMSAINHQPIWKGMLIGAATGAAGGGLGAGLGALGGAAGASGGASGAAGGTAGAAGGTGGGVTGGVAGGTTGGTTGGVTGGVTGGTTGGTTGGVTGGSSGALANPTVSAALSQSPTAITSQGMGAATNAPTIGLGGAAPSAPAATAESGLTSMVDKALPALKGAAPGALLDMAKGVMGGTTYTGDAGEEQKANELQGSQWAADTYGSTGGSWLPGKAKGGAVHLKNGDFIVPADVVSAIGNGSTKAGAKYLDHLFNALHAGPPPKAGSLAKQRARQRHSA